MVSVLVFFPPNCTSWKQPCDQGIIAALKKGYKHLHLQDVLSFYEMQDELKQLKKEAGSRLRRGAAGVEYGNPATLFDAANYVKICWDMICPETIKNCFKKAALMGLESQPEVLIDHEINNDTIVELLLGMRCLNLSIEEIDEYLHNDDETSLLYTEEVLNDVDELLQHLNNNKLLLECTEDDEDNIDVGQPVELENNFDGFQALYKNFLQIKQQINLQNFVNIGADDKYDNFSCAFENIDQIFRQLSRIEHKKKEECCPKVQLTLHDYFFRKKS